MCVCVNLLSNTIPHHSPPFTTIHLATNPHLWRLRGLRTLPKVPEPNMQLRSKFLVDACRFCCCWDFCGKPMALWKSKQHLVGKSVNNIQLLIFSNSDPFGVALPYFYRSLRRTLTVPWSLPLSIHCSPHWDASRSSADLAANHDIGARKFHKLGYKGNSGDREIHIFYVYIYIYIYT